MTVKIHPAVQLILNIIMIITLKSVTSELEQHTIL